MMMQKLIDYSEETLFRGLILRCKAQYPYEEVVDFMICETYEEDSGFTLNVVSGYKAGLRFVILPKESSDDRLGINATWLRNNWEKWGYNDCAVKDVLVIETTVPK
jgi:hypothetical protein